MKGLQDIMLEMKFAVIDDEPQAIDSLKFYVQNFDVDGLTFAHVTESDDLGRDPEADRELLTSVDVLFLDIMLFGRNSLDLIKPYRDIQPITVITTAEDQHMLEAIRVSAFDYLLKPIDVDDFKAMQHRLKEKVERDYTRMREWLSLSNVINTHQLNASQQKTISNIKDTIYENITRQFPQLTQTDKRLLMLIKFGFSNKEIASHLSIEPESVKRSKVRLKKRMGIDKELSIEEAIVEI